MPEPATSPRKISYAERRIQALELRKAGATYEQIGKQLGITKQAAYKHVKKALDAMNDTIREQADDVRNIEVERLDKLWFVMYKQALSGNQGAVDRCLKIMDRRAKLLGLDAPEKQETTGETILRVVYDEKPHE